MTTSIGRSRHKVGSGYYGKIPPEVWTVVEQAYDNRIYLKSDFARAYAPWVAAGASLGWITNIDIRGEEFLPYWVATAEGLHAYRNRKDT